jgi:streptomycin 6-kinase
VRKDKQGREKKKRCKQVFENNEDVSQNLKTNRFNKALQKQIRAKALEKKALIIRWVISYCKLTLAPVRVLREVS